jgi:hypothetical protein
LYMESTQSPERGDEMIELKRCPECGSIHEDELNAKIAELEHVIRELMKNNQECHVVQFVNDSIEPDIDKMPIEKINQYLREHGYDPEKVGLRGQILAEALTRNVIAREVIQQLLTNPFGCRFCDYGVLREPDNPLKGHDEDCPYLAARAYLDNETSTVVKRDLSDAEINELGAQEAERRDKK